MDAIDQHPAAIRAYAAAARADGVDPELRPATIRRYARAAEKAAQEAEAVGATRAAAMAWDAAFYATGLIATKHPWAR